LSEGINILDVPASDTNGFLLRNECVSSTQLKRPIWTNIASLHHENPKLQEVFIKKIAQFSEGNSVLDTLASNTNGFLWRDTCVTLLQLNRPTWNKESPTPLGKT
jgi:hypothetical protein